ncbi:MAG: ATP-binding protein [Thermoanaerobaculia bacterium]
MLGRQQIAGIPTAISELFKNAHDAYADRAEVDYYRSDRLFVLRDDGVGMTSEDFEKRWLTLGTESKMTARTVLGPPPADPKKSPRAILGEKGIGRLAIAAIGPQVLILSRAERGSQLMELVAAYIHWGLFELPGVDLDEIEVPIRLFPIGAVPGRTIIAEMLDTVEDNVERLGERVSPDARDRILKDLGSMRAIDMEEVEAYFPDLDLRSRRGTHFIIIPADRMLDADLDDNESDEASSLEKLLLGFTNSMTPNHPQPVITTAFRDHKTDEAFEDLVREERFFSPEEFGNADHYISGHFDDFGQFRGTVSVYGENHKNYLVAWPGAMGSSTNCGPFEIHLAAIQPNARETTLPPEEHARLLAKTRRFGGLYIYRDGIRILPYGDVDYDWLEMEKRRTKGAAYYYFSHRNLFGAVLLSQKHNTSLTEKAGREGFRENAAYRQLRDILKNFLIQVAGDFFREEGPYADRFQQTREQLTRQHRALEKRKGLTAERRRSFGEALERFFTAFDSNEPSQRAFELAKSVEHDLTLAQNVTDPQRAAILLLDIESRARTSLRELEESYHIAKPRGIGLSRKLIRDYEEYESAYARLHTEVFSEVRDLVEGDVTAAAERARIELDRRLRVERALAELAENAKRTAKSERSETQEALERVRIEVREAARERQVAVEEAVRTTLSAFASTDVQELNDESLIALRSNLERQIIDVQERSAEFLRYVRSQLQAIDLSGELGQLDQIEALEQRSLELEERSEYDLQLAQLGMAVDVINHEFDASVRSIRNNLRRLHAWADVNRDLEGLYKDLRTSFDHLDGYLTLFTPLHRRLNRQQATFNGSDIARYLRDLFGPRFERHGVELRATLQFREWSITSYPSSFYPVFVNLVDNAVFWLDRVTTERTIELDAEGDTVYVSNTGEPIPARRREIIFDQGVSFKPAGRGLGLYISREILRGVGYGLTVSEPRSGMKVTFCIKPLELDNHE